MAVDDYPRHHGSLVGLNADHHPQYHTDARGDARYAKKSGDTFTAPDAATKPLIVKGAAGQTANLQEWQDSTGSVVSSVHLSGKIVGEKGLQSNGPLSGVAGNPVIAAFVDAPGNPGLLVRGASGQTANLQEWNNNAGTVLASVNRGGVPTFDSPALTMGRAFSSQSISSSSVTVVGFDHLQASQNLATAWMSANVGADGYVRIVGKGVYLFIGRVWWTGNATGRREIYLSQYSDSDVFNYDFAGVASPAPNSEVMSQNVSGIFIQSAGPNRIKLRVWQNSGSAVSLALSTGVYATQLHAVKIA